MSWKASARAGTTDGINYPRLSDGEERRLRKIKAQEAKEKTEDLERGFYLFFAGVAAAVSIGVAWGFNRFATELVPRNIAVAWALSSGAGSVAINLRKAGLKKRERELKILGANRSEKILELPNNGEYSVNELETVLTNTYALWDFIKDDKGRQPYVDGFNAKAGSKVRNICIDQFAQDLRADSQIGRFLSCLELAQKLSDECPEKLSALGECGKLIAEPGFMQKLARYVSTGNTNGRSEQIKLIVDSEYLPCIEEELYLLCRSALVNLAVMSKNEELHETINEYDDWGADREASSILHGVICSSATVCNGLASRLEQEIGLDIIEQIKRSDSYSLSDDQVAAIAQWSEQHRCYDPLVEAIDKLKTLPPVFPAINPPEGRAR